MWALGGASDAKISTQSSFRHIFYLFTMKKTIFLAALVAAAVPASAQITFQSENEIKFVPGDLTADKLAKVYTIDDDDNVEVYDASLNRIKSFKINAPTVLSGTKEEICRNAENITLTGCELYDNGEYSYRNENGERVTLTATSVDDMIEKLHNLQGRNLYKISINGKAGAYHSNDFYSLSEDGKVFSYNWYFSYWESIIEIGNEDALAWETIYDDSYEYGNYGYLEYYNFDNSTNSADMSFEISQTLFNDDSKWEYVVGKYEPIDKTEYFSIEGFDDGKAIIVRSTSYGASNVGFSIMNEDGVEVGFIANPENDNDFYLFSVVVIGNKKYISAIDDSYSYLFDFDNLSSGAALVVERKDNMRVVSQGDMVEIILPKDAANGEVGIVGMNGQTLGRQKVGDGQSRATFNSANLAKGVYNATFTHRNGKRESQKFLVK